MKNKLLFSIIVVNLLCGSPVLSWAGQLTEDDISYVGSFRLPLSSGGYSYTYGMYGIGYYKDPTYGPSLFVRAHTSQEGYIGQLAIPDTLGTGDWSSLPEATILQDIKDVTDGEGATGFFTDTYDEEWDFYGIMVYGDRLILGATADFAVGSQQVATHAASGLDLSVSGDYTGAESYGGDPGTARYIGGYMATIPEEKQSLFGGAKAVTGSVARSIISTTSDGPALSLFDPALLGNEASPHAVNTLLAYRTGQGTGLSKNCPSTGMCEDPLFNAVSLVAGVAIPSGYDTVLFFGSHDIADGDGFCYSTVACCSSAGPCDSGGYNVNGPYPGYNSPVCTDGKGEHSDSIKDVIWAYDIQDLVDVYNGKQNMYDPVPDLWQDVLSDVIGPGLACVPRMKSAAYDDETRLVYIATGGTEPQIFVFKIAEKPSQKNSEYPVYDFLVPVLAGEHDDKGN